VRLEIVGGGAAHLASARDLFCADVVAPVQPAEIHDADAPHLLLIARRLSQPLCLYLHLLQFAHCVPSVRITLQRR
jgi:hypothetical protein